MTVRSGKWVSGGALFVRLNKSGVTRGNIYIGRVGEGYFSKRFDDTFDVISEWGTECARPVASCGGGSGPYIHLSRTFARRFAIGSLVKFEKISRSVVRLSLLAGAAEGTSLQITGLAAISEARAMVEEALWMIDHRRYCWADRCLARAERLLP